MSELPPALPRPGRGTGRAGFGAGGPGAVLLLLLVAVLVASGFSPTVGAGRPHAPSLDRTTAGRAPASSPQFTWVTTSRSVGSDPMALSFYPGRATIFVANSGSSNVTRFNRGSNASIGSIPVTNGPVALVNDSNDAATFVASSRNASVGVIYGSADVVGSWVGVGQDPIALAFAPVFDQVLVANERSNSLSVIDTSNLSVVATVTVGAGPVAIAYAASTGTAWVVDGGSDTISVVQLNTNPLLDAVTATLPTGLNPTSVAYDPVTGQMFVTNEESGNLSVYGVLSESVTHNVPCCSSAAPAQIAYASDLGAMIVSESANDVLTFVSSSTLATTGTLKLPGAINALVYDPTTNTILTANAASSTISFIARVATYPTTFAESGLSSGARWSVAVPPAAPVSTTNSTLLLWIANGTYTYAVTPVSGYTTTYTGPFLVNGGAVTIPIEFVPFFSTLLFVETGLPSLTPWSVNLTSASLNSTTEGSTNATVSFGVMNGSYRYAIGPIAGYTARYNGAVDVAHLVVEVNVTFSPTLYAVTFVSSGLPAGIAWTVTVNAESENSSHGALLFRLSNGTWIYNVSAPTGYLVVPSELGTFLVDGASLTVTINFTAVPSVANATASATLVLYAIIGAAVGAVVVVIVVLLLMRSRATPTPARRPRPPAARPAASRPVAPRPARPSPPAPAAPPARAPSPSAGEDDYEVYGQS